MLQATQFAECNLNENKENGDQFFTKNDWQWKELCY